MISTIMKLILKESLTELALKLISQTNSTTFAMAVHDWDLNRIISDYPKMHTLKSHICSTILKWNFGTFHCSKV